MGNLFDAKELVNLAVKDHDAGGWQHAGMNEILETRITAALDRKDERIAKLEAALREAQMALWTANVQFMSMHHATVIHGVPESPEALKKECRQGMADCHPAIVAIDAVLGEEG